MGQAIRLDCVGEGGYDFCLVGDVGERFWAVLFHPGGGGGGGRGGHGQSLPEQIIMVAPAARLSIQLLRRNDVYSFTWPALSKIDLVLSLVRAFNHIFSHIFLTWCFRHKINRDTMAFEMMELYFSMPKQIPYRDKVR
jgi:hypothetical protein